MNHPSLTADRKTICLMDDEPDIREIYTVALTGEGFDVLPAEDGEKGLAILREKHPNIVLLDLQMPIKDGFDVLQEMANDPSISRIPVIILSNSDDEHAFRRVGTFDTKFFFIKSLTTPKKVAGAVREILFE